MDNDTEMGDGGAGDPVGTEMGAAGGVGSVAAGVGGEPTGQWEGGMMESGNFVTARQTRYGVLAPNAWSAQTELHANATEIINQYGYSKTVKLPFKQLQGNNMESYMPPHQWKQFQMRYKAFRVAGIRTRVHNLKFFMKQMSGTTVTYVPDPQGMAYVVTGNKVPFTAGAIMPYTTATNDATQDSMVKRFRPYIGQPPDSAKPAVMTNSHFFTGGTAYEGNGSLYVPQAQIPLVASGDMRVVKSADVIETVDTWDDTPWIQMHHHTNAFLLDGVHPDLMAGLAHTTSVNTAPSFGFRGWWDEQTLALPQGATYTSNATTGKEWTVMPYLDEPHWYFNRNWEKMAQSEKHMAKVGIIMLNGVTNSTSPTVKQTEPAICARKFTQSQVASNLKMVLADQAAIAAIQPCEVGQVPRGCAQYNKRNFYPWDPLFVPKPDGTGEVRPVDNMYCFMDKSRCPSGIMMQLQRNAFDEAGTQLTEPCMNFMVTHEILLEVKHADKFWQPDQTDTMQASSRFHPAPPGYFWSATIAGSSISNDDVQTTANTAWAPGRGGY